MKIHYNLDGYKFNNSRTKESAYAKHIRKKAILKNRYKIENMFAKIKR